jgi:hypothetical protein
MKITSAHLKYFLGKVCTIFTTQINRDFRTENPQKYPMMVYQYFIGYVEAIDDTGVLIKQAATGLKTFLFLDHVVGIAEEEVEELKPEEVQILNAQAQEEAPPAFAMPATDGQTVDVDALANLAKKAKEAFKQKS